MSVSGINSVSTYYFGNTAKQKDKDQTSSFNALLENRSSTTTERTSSTADSYTGLGDGSTLVGTTLNMASLPQTSLSASTLKSMPLSEAWAPQMFVQGDQNGDGVLSEDEFAAQLARVGTSSEMAQELYKSFGGTADHGLTLDQYYEGIKKENLSNSPIFSQLVSSYVDNANGTFDAAMMSSFIDKGAASAKSFWG